MKNKINYLIIAVLVSVSFVSCTKEVGPMSDLKPAIPVTVVNAMAYRPEPTVSTTLATTDSIIRIVLSIPQGSNKTITAIKVATSTSYTQIQSTGTTGFYPLGTMTISGNTATFVTSIREYFINKPFNATTNPAAAKDKELTNRYYFAITLSDGTIIIPEPVRVLVL
jgi:hypothetical protein